MTQQQPNQVPDELRPIPMVNGLDCPACGHPTLMLADGGYITCCLEECPNPDYAEAIEAYCNKASAEAELRGRINELRDNQNQVGYDPGSIAETSEAVMERIAELEAELTANKKGKSDE